jgi:hypothetical protein
MLTRVLSTEDPLTEIMGQAQDEAEAIMNA